MADDCDCQKDYAVNLERLTCGDCGGPFELVKNFVASRRRDGKKFHCPYCAREVGFTVPKPEPKPEPKVETPAPWWRFW